jgi:hypothetical protein
MVNTSSKTSSKFHSSTKQVMGEHTKMLTLQSVKANLPSFKVAVGARKIEQYLFFWETLNTNKFK